MRSQFLDDPNLLMGLVDAHGLGGDLDEHSVLRQSPNAVYRSAVPFHVERVRAFIVAHVKMNSGGARVGTCGSFTPQL